jgi:hypothetical protein
VSGDTEPSSDWSRLSLLFEGSLSAAILVLDSIMETSPNLLADRLTERLEPDALGVRPAFFVCDDIRLGPNIYRFRFYELIKYVFLFYFIVLPKLCECRVDDRRLAVVESGLKKREAAGLYSSDLPPPS